MSGDSIDNGPLVDALRLLLRDPQEYPFAAMTRLRSCIEGLSAQLAECEADVHDDQARRDLWEALSEALS